MGPAARVGFIDVAYAPGPNPQSSDFIPLATVPDFWPWMQASQTNFSIPVSVPNIDCPHCVIRVRYHPNSASPRADAASMIIVMDGSLLEGKSAHTSSV